MEPSRSDKNLFGIVDRLLEATNAFEVEAAVALFAADAVIDDVSVGDSFIGHAGARDYLNRFFVGYHTVSRKLSVELDANNKIAVRIDFTGDFGHENGLLNLSLNQDGSISSVHADLE